MWVCVLYALHDFRNRKYVALFHWISNLCTQSNFAHVFAVAIDVVDIYCDFSISISINIFSLSAPDLHVCLSHFVFMSFILHSVFFSPYVALFFVWIYINESLIEQKITSVQSDACLKGGPLTKSSFPCLMQNWSELNEEQITATAAMIQTTTATTTTMMMMTKECDREKEKTHTAPIPFSVANIFSLQKYFNLISVGFICGRIWTEIKQFPK